LSAQTPFVLYTNFAPAVLTYARDNGFVYEVTAFSTEEERSGNIITLRNGGDYTRKAFEVIQAHPIAAAYSATRTVFSFFTSDGWFTLLARSGYRPADFLPLMLAGRLFWAALTLAACIGALVFVLRRRTPATILILLLVAYFALTSIITGFGVNPRYRLPVDPILIALAGTGCATLVAWIRRKTPTTS